MDLGIKYNPSTAHMGRVTFNTIKTADAVVRTIKTLLASCIPVYLMIPAYVFPIKKDKENTAIIQGKKRTANAHSF
jgi:hypothetical protein